MMNADVIAYASMLHLSRADVKVLKVKDTYSIHRVVYGLFEDTRTEPDKKGSVSSGILFADKGGDFHSRKILILSDRKPHTTPQFGEVQSRPVSNAFLGWDRYVFEVTVNPGKRDSRTGKVLPVIGRENIHQWFLDRAMNSWGFSVSPNSLEVVRAGVQSFEKDGFKITHGSATLKGALTVIDRDRFVKSFTKGVGRGRAFGFGLLQIVPLQDS
jgi:CRISPR system Cascade subunit CasE